jgi:predicted lipoprotein with Yx(FWY)xxD motif
VGSESSGGTNILAITGGFNHATATLYTFTVETPKTSKCTGTCAFFWPPVLTTATPAATGKANTAKLGVIPRADGTFQVTYNGQPLYFVANGLNTGTSGNAISAFGGTCHTVNA